MKFGEAVREMIDNGEVCSREENLYMRHSDNGLEDGLYNENGFVWQEANLTDEDIDDENWEVVAPDQVPDAGDPMPDEEIPVEVDRRCINCDYYMPRAGAIWENTGQCRREPPKLGRVRPMTAAVERLCDILRCLWPETEPMEWCGAFKERVDG